jgi:hypothetical protein
MITSLAIVLAVILLLSTVIVWCKRKPYVSIFSAAGPWHKITADREPASTGIPVLTEYINSDHRWHGFRVDTYSTKLHKWMEADVWDQEVVAYAEIKSNRKLSHEST